MAGIYKQQLPLDLSHDVAMGREDFLEGPANEKALALIDQWPDWPSLWVLLAGPVGAGKSHLARIWQERSGACLISVEVLSEHDPTELVRSGALVVEDADSQGRDDVALFHLLNAAKEAEASILMTARNWPDSWGVALPDLASRLRLTTPVELYEPDDLLLRMVLIKLFADRQLVVEPSVVDFIVLRMERSIASAQQIVGLLDQQALAHKRAITSRLAGEVLKSIERGDNA